MFHRVRLTNGFGGAISGREAMANEIATCKQCRHKTPDHYCTHPQTQDKEGKPCLARHVWYVSYNDRGDYCAGKFFEPAIATPNAIVSGLPHEGD